MTTSSLSRERAAEAGSNSALFRFRLGFKHWWPFYVMLAPGVIFFVIFHYLPIWEAQIAFEQVRIIPPNIWVGLKNFQQLFGSVVFWQVMANTIIISAMKMAFVFPVPIVVALLLNELRSSRFRQTVQSVLYLPHFLGWVVISAIFIAQLSPSTGGVNDVLQLVGLKPINFMTEPNWIRWILVISENWRSAAAPSSACSMKSPGAPTMCAAICRRD
jgi:putative aldouronate transport system permease protein